ncbi:MAG TPA: MFS transporter, partial [Phenylobacterium sp.]|nr:MFS transporter [Phenylobacterium sp.]
FYAYTTYMQKFLVNTAGFSKDTATTISAGSLLAYMFIQPMFGSLSDRIGRKTTLIFAFGVGCLITYPLMSRIAVTHDAWAAFLMVVALLIVLSGYTAVNAVLKAELFPAHVRALGVALPYALANSIFGGSAEYVALWFKQARMESGFYIYVSLVMAVALVVAIRLRNTNKESLIAED